MLMSAVKSRHRIFQLLLLALLNMGVLCTLAADTGNRLQPVAAPGETFTSFTLAGGVRGIIHAPADDVTTRSNRLVLYLLPNGSTTEEALGRTPEAEVSWKYGIQHIAAQTRRVRQLMALWPVTTVIVESDKLSWPAWRKADAQSDQRIGEMVQDIRSRIAGPLSTVDLVAHSGGGSFIWGYLNSVDEIPRYISHIVFLDANYSYSDDDGHGDKLVKWLEADKTHRLVVLAYDDRRIKLNGKPVVSETGGTWRATDRMARRLERDMEFKSGMVNDYVTSSALDGRVLLMRHPNPDDKILHTVLVERNGFVYGVSHGRVALPEHDLPFFPEAGKEAYREFIFPR